MTNPDLPPIDPVTLDPTDPEAAQAAEVRQIEVTDESMQTPEGVIDALQAAANVLTCITNNVEPDLLHSIMAERMSLVQLAQLSALLISSGAVAATATATQAMKYGPDSIKRAEAVLGQLTELADQAGIARK